MNRDLLLFCACIALSLLSAGGLLLLRNPDSFLSRLVDRPADDTTTVGGPR